MVRALYWGAQRLDGVQVVVGGGGGGGGGGGKEEKKNQFGNRAGPFKEGCSYQTKLVGKIKAGKDMCAACKFSVKNSNV